jgi:hypothetical protein
MAKLVWTLVTIAMGVGASYLLAKAGRPDNLWLWRDVMGVLG